MKTFFLPFSALFLPLQILLAQSNVMSIPDASGSAADTVQVDVEIDNSDPFVAFQFDLPLPEIAEFVDGSAGLTSRANGHDLVATLIEDTLRVLSYSTAQDTFSGTSGPVMNFEVVLGAVPGSYPLDLIDAIIGNASTDNILTGVDNGILTLSAPDISVNPDSLNFGEVPLTQWADRSFTITNNGNASLDVTMVYTDHADFVVLGDTTYVIAQGNSENVTVRFYANTKGTYDQNAIVESDDPDETSVSIPLTVYAFAVNELDVNDTSGRSGFPTTLSLDISNMEPFVGFQFDLILSSVMTYVEGSVTLTSRATDHTVSASMTGSDTLTVVAYSPTNEAFLGIDGDVVELTFDLEGQGGFYNINLHDPIIADSLGSNIISDYFGGQVEIVSPDIWSDPTSIDFGVVSIFDTTTVSLELGNNGSDTLFFGDFTFSDTVFFGDFSGVDRLEVGSSIVKPIHFHSGQEGEFNGTLTVSSNDPDEDPYVVAMAGEAFIPNIMSLSDVVVPEGYSANGDLCVENNEPFVAFQCDIMFPSEANYVEGSAELTSRAVDHDLVATMVSSDTLRLISYSLTQAEFLGDSGAVVVFDVEATGPSGSYAYTLSNPVLSNDQSENILSSTEDGEIFIPGPPATITDLTAALVGTDVRLSWSEVTEDDQGNPLIVDHYVVYRHEDPLFSSTPPDSIGSTIETMYDDPTPAVGDPNLNHFYVVKAADAWGRKSNDSNAAGEVDFELP